MRVSILRLLAVVALACVGVSINAMPAQAATNGPGWELAATTAPTNLIPSQAAGEPSGTIVVDVFNVGAASSHGEITVTDVLPEGIKAKAAGELLDEEEASGKNFGLDPRIGHELWDCSGNGSGAAPHVEGATVVTCTNDPVGLPVFAGGGGLPAGPANLPANPQPPIAVQVEAASEAAGLGNRVSIAGGGAKTPASTEETINVSSHPASGLVGWDAWFSSADGTIDTQAGSHPYEATFIFDLATALNEQKEWSLPGGEARDLEVQLPPGLVGNPLAVPQCTREELHEEQCPQASQIGDIEIRAKEFQFGIRVYNVVPPPGVAAEFAFNLEHILVFLDSTVRTGGDYGITTHINNIPQKEAMQSILTLWDEPGDPSHDPWRSGSLGGCTPEQIAEGRNGGLQNHCAEPQYPIRKPLLTLPTACGESQPLLIRELSGWQDPGQKSEVEIKSHDSSDVPSGFTGCEDLAFGPAITTSPDTAKADTPTGLTVEVKPPVGGLEESGLLGTADIQDTKVTLPPGFVINPGQAAGLQACGAAEDGLTTEVEKFEGKENDGPPSCPNASKVGTVTIKSPLIEQAEEKQFEGNVYVLRSNPPELKLLVAASADGVNLKLVGVVHLNEQTGQLTTTFEGTPQLPFTVFKLSFSGGPQAALDTPTQCGAYSTSADFTPWSSPFVQDFATDASFVLSEGPGGGACPSDPMPFAPSLTAGSTTDQAGGFTGFSLLLQRADGQQRIEKLQFKEPAGAAGVISQVPLCPEPQASQGMCSSASHIGHSVVTSGPGPYPLVLPQPGDPELPIYLTGPYEGAPFGLSIVTPVIAGPFNLGTIVTRARIEVDPHTAQITITTDPLPQIVDGVPTDLRSIDAVIDRSDFLFNPTNCTSSSFSGTATSAQGTQAAISSPFRVGSCQSLKFTPKFSVSTPGKTSKADGAGLTAKLSYPNGSLGTQANITRVKVDLPKQLPSRLTTLQKACTNAQFEADPAACPAASKIGMATVTTPVLPVPLTGPAIFVSHGGEAFPSLTMVLQGDNVTVDLIGTTFISKAGITSTTFKTVPDVPFNTFTLTLPQGKYSALAANGNLCTTKLAMPTEFLAQNGLKINQSTPVTATGCAKKKALTRAQKLAAALKACRKKAKGKRAACEAAARRKDGPLKKRQKKK